MNCVERIKAICKERKIAISKLESDCGFSNAYIAQLRKGTMPADRLLKVSEYLGLSPEYLLYGQEKSPSSEDNELDDLDIEILSLIQKLTPENYTRALAYIQGLVAGQQ